MQQTRRLNTIIQNVRRATRQPEAHFETVTVRELLNETLSLVEPLMRKAGIELQVDFDEKVPGIHADRYRVQTALFNLIQNAIESMPTGGRITVSARGSRTGLSDTITGCAQGNGCRRFKR